ncbi:unnamed protein product [Thlaspi arvense]|uniref:ATP synthase protein MI25 n=1 Tax=Thlaspi arvense TaxID=13288 RepID=A0AAU9SGG0_THLAR|nr:unnamed protein product [Thlaspi arvense]
MDERLLQSRLLSLNAGDHSLVAFAGLMAGLTLGLMSLGLVDLEVLIKSSRPQDQLNAGFVNFPRMLSLCFVDFAIGHLDVELNDAGRQQAVKGGGESLDKLYGRCTSALQRIGEKHKGERVEVVTRGGVIRSLHETIDAFSSHSSLRLYQYSWIKLCLHGLLLFAQ